MRKYRRVECEDGFSMSVQGSSTAYCAPRVDNATYFEVEVGYPSEKENMLKPYAEFWDKPTDTVYGYVPVNTIYLIITKHGGMVSGECPAGVPVYEHMKFGDTHEDR